MGDDLTDMGISATAAAAMGREQVVLAHHPEHPLAGNTDATTDPKPSPDLTVSLVPGGVERAEGVSGMTLLDIGGGIGTIQLEMLSAGASEAISVEASIAHMEAGQEEARRQGSRDHVRHRHGDFVELAPDIAPVDIVTLDKVICCYDDMQNLVGLSSARAGKLYGVVYPRDVWWIKPLLSVANFFLWARRNPFRVFAHSTAAVDALVTGNGLRQKFRRTTFWMQVLVYAR